MCDPFALLLKIANEKTKQEKWLNQPLQLIKIMSNTYKELKKEDT